jgi:hypothetical protein
MAGERLGRGLRLATGPQLYVLNRAGLLELRETPDEKLSNSDADSAIRRSMSADDARDGRVGLVRRRPKGAEDG